MLIPLKQANGARSIHTQANTGWTLMSRRGPEGCVRPPVKLIKAAYTGPRSGACM
jgi:hypothetical protein